MQRNDAFGLVILFLSVGAIALAGGTVGNKIGITNERVRFRQEAVQAGHAEWTIVDPVTGQTEFRWKDVSR